MTTYEKLVEGATKIKMAPPKPKYIEPILMATANGEDSEAFETVMRTLARRLQDSAWTIVYKSLITLHIMIREGDENVTIRYLSRHPSLLDAKIIKGNGQYIANGGDMHTLSAYAGYLITRGREFRATRHDFITETKRPVGAWSSKDEGSSLRKLTIEKGLLREIESVQRQIDALIHCRFRESEVNNDLIVLGFRMLTTDLLSLYQTLNEGVLNILEHFFELSKYDADRAFKAYTAFTKETAQVIEFLRVAKHLEHVTKLHVPTIKHAQTSLTSSLRDYIEDPYFESNRRQYMAEKEAEDKVNVGGKKQHRHNKDKKSGSKQAQPAQSAKSAQPPQQSQTPQQTQVSQPAPTGQTAPQVVQGNPFSANVTGVPVAVPIQAVPVQATGIAPQGGLVLQTTGFNPFSGLTTFTPGALPVVPEVAQMQPNSTVSTLPFVAPLQPMQTAPVMPLSTIPQPMAQPQLTGGLPLIGQQPQQMLTAQQTFPAPIQAPQITGSAAVRGNLRKSATTTNPFAVGGATSAAQAVQPSQNPFAATRFAEGSQTTALSFNTGASQLTGNVSTPGQHRLSVSNPFASAGPSLAEQQQLQQQQQQQQLQALRSQPTAGGLENLPTVPIFPETKKAAADQQRMINAAQQLQQQKTQNYLQQQQTAGNRTSTYNPFMSAAPQAAPLPQMPQAVPQPMAQPQQPIATGSFNFAPIQQQVTSVGLNFTPAPISQVVSNQQPVQQQQQQQQQTQPQPQQPVLSSVYNGPNLLG